MGIPVVPTASTSHALWGRYSSAGSGGGLALDFSSAMSSHPGGLDFPLTTPAFLLLTEWVHVLCSNKKALGHSVSCLLHLCLPGVRLDPAPSNLGPNSMVELLHPKALVTSLLLLPKFLITGFPSIFVLLSKLKPWNRSSLKVLT